MTEEDNDGANPGPGGETWELAKLIGNYERFTKEVDNRLTGIEARLEEGSSSFSDIKSTMATKTEQLDNLEKRLTTVEENGATLNKRRRLQIDGTLVATIFLTLKEIIEAILGAIR